MPHSYRLLSSYILITLLACSDSPNDNTSTESNAEVVEETTEVVANSSQREIAHPFTLYHSRSDDSLNILWYEDEIFSRAAVESGIFTGEWSISPEAEGTLEVISTQKVRFTPSKPLAPNTEYTLTIEKIGDVQDDDVELRPSSPDLWVQKETTASFGVLGVSFGKVERNAGRAQVLLRLSHPISADYLAKATTVLLNGNAVDFKATKHDDEGQIAITINNQNLVDQSISVAIAPLTYAEQYESEPYEWVGRLGNWKPIQMYGPFVDESGTGFTIEYICDDTAVEERSWYWKSKFSFDERISRRCTIDTEQLRNNIQIEPAVRDLQVYPRERGFALVGDFTHGDHEITIPAGIGSQDGGGLLDTLVDSVVIPHRSPSVRFHSMGRYLPIDAWTSVHFQHRNIDRLDLTIHEVQKQNIHNWIDDYDEKVSSSEGRQLVKTTIDLTHKKDQMSRSVLNLKEYIPERSAGIYQVELRDPNSNAKTRLTLQVTDMNLITKRFRLEDGSQEISTWVMNSRTNAPMSSVELSIVSKSGDVTNTCRTDNTGYCSFTIPKDDLNNNAFAIYAERTSSDSQPEMAYLVFDQLSIDLGLYDASGTTGSNKDYRIAAHSERGAYRPGDTAHLFAFVRNKSNEAPTAGMPVILRIKDGRGQVVVEKVLNVNAAGLINYELNIADYANTGTWQAEWTVTGAEKDDNLGTQTSSFKVENLIPERLSVKSSFVESEQLGGTELSGTVSAKYLFGKTAEGANFTVRCDVESTPFSPRSNGNYTYGSETAFEDFHLGTTQGTLNADGEASFICPHPERVKNLPGMATVVASIDVMENGSGRSTKRTARTKVHPTQQYIGLQIGGNTTEIDAGRLYPVNGIVVDWKGQRLQNVASVDVQVSEIEIAYNWLYNETTGEYETQRNRFEIPLKSQTVSVKKGLFQMNFESEPYIDAYRISASNGSSVTNLDLSMGYRYGRTRVETPDPFRPDHMDIQVPISMNLTETATVSTLVPYPGRLLWTVENDGIIRQEWVDVDVAGEQQWSFSLAGHPFENTVYVTALLVKDAHSDSSAAYMPARAFGTQPIKVRSKKFNHTLSVDVPSEIQANETLSVNLNLNGAVEDNTYAMVAVVDEGLLSLTNFQTPDPSNALFPKMPLSVETAETVGWGIATPAMDSAPAGGGADGGDARRKARVVKPVSLWSGIVPVDPSGTVSIPVKIPQYSGAVRVMAWSASPTRFASVDSEVLVREPLTVQSTVPRFLTEGDIFDVPVSVTNLSGIDQKVTVSLNAKSLIPVGRTGATETQSVAFLSDKKSTFTLKSDEDRTVVFQAKALAESGFATFTVDVKNADASLTSTESNEVPFGSKKPIERQFTKITLDEAIASTSNGKLDLDAYLEDWISEDTTIWATNNPYSESLVRVRDLLRYPYGCVEQTSSSLRPLLSAAETLEFIDPETVKLKPIEKMAQAGIDRLASMQTSDGGLGYWPGSSSSHPWGTAYAMHVLLDAKAAGHTVMPSLLSGANNYLLAFVNGNFDYRYDSYVLETKPYAHYILARQGKGQPVAIRSLLENNNYEMRYESEYMLKTALYLSGDRTYETELKDLTDLNKVNDLYYRWSFRSKLRSYGLILALHQEMFGVTEESGEALAMNIHNKIVESKQRYLSTQDVAWSTFALAQRVQQNTSWKAPDVLLNDKSLADVSNKPGNRSWMVWDNDRNNNEIDLKTNSSGGYLMLSTRGIRKSGDYQYGDNGLRISREYRNMDGSVFNPTTHKLGDEVVVVLTIENLGSSDLSELAVVDRIPAGWEIQNSNLSRSLGNLEQFTSNSIWEHDYLSIKDNQIEIFGDLNNRYTRSIVYAVRSTTGGTFTIPPVSIESMYDDALWSRHQGMILQVNGFWDGQRL